jgi:hypothetical protein
MAEKAALINAPFYLTTVLPQAALGKMGFA